MENPALAATERAALIALLDDPNPAVRRALGARFTALGEAAGVMLREVAAGGDRYAIPLQQEHTVTPGHYFAMGDNSANSFDSRGWGEVPAQDVVGKPLFILHPFTSHWGPAK